MFFFSALYLLVVGICSYAAVSCEQLLSCSYLSYEQWRCCKFLVDCGLGISHMSRERLALVHLITFLRQNMTFLS